MPSPKMDFCTARPSAVAGLLRHGALLFQRQGDLVFRKHFVHQLHGRFRAGKADVGRALIQRFPNFHGRCAHAQRGVHLRLEVVQRLTAVSTTSVTSMRCLSLSVP